MLNKRSLNNQLMGLCLMQANSNRRVKKNRFIKNFIASCRSFMNVIQINRPVKKKRRRGLNRNKTFFQKFFLGK